MERDRSKPPVSERIKRRLGFSAAEERNPETGRSYAEERMIAIMQKRGGKGFRILRSAETSVKKYERPTN